MTEEEIKALQSEVEVLKAKVEKQKEEITYLKSGKEYTFKLKFEEIKRLHDSLNETVVKLHEQVAEKDGEIQRLMHQLFAAQENLVQQKGVVATYLADAEEYKNSLEQELTELKEEAKARG